VDGQPLDAKGRGLFSQNRLAVKPGDTAYQAVAIDKAPTACPRAEGLRLTFPGGSAPTAIPVGGARFCPGTSEVLVFGATTNVPNINI
jgi:hypothetical protein